MQTKSYTAKSSVRRAAKQIEGFNLDTLVILQDSDGLWYGEDGVEPEAQDESSIAGIGGVHPTGDYEDNQEEEDLPEENDCRKPMVYNESGDSVPADSLPDPKATVVQVKDTIKVSKAHDNHSSISKPCKTVWEICEKMKGCPRKDVIAACCDAGVAYNTARTQYQQWFTASKGQTK